MLTAMHAALSGTVPLSGIPHSLLATPKDCDPKDYACCLGELLRQTSQVSASNSSHHTPLFQTACFFVPSSRESQIPEAFRSRSFMKLLSAAG